MLVGDKSQLVFWWLALARRMYQTDYVAKWSSSYDKLVPNFTQHRYS